MALPCAVIMPEPVCPHCGKVTEGEPHDKDIYVIVVCEECQTILTILPKYFQKCTWKRPPEDYVEAVEVEVREVVVRPKERWKERTKEKPTWD